MNLSDYCGQLTTCMIPYESKHLHIQSLFRVAPKRQKYMLTFSVLKGDFFLWKTDYNTVLHYSSCATDPLAVLKQSWNDKTCTRWMFTQPNFYITHVAWLQRVKSCIYAHSSLFGIYSNTPWNVFQTHPTRFWRSCKWLKALPNKI